MTKLEGLHNPIESEKAFANVCKIMEDTNNPDQAIDWLLFKSFICIHDMALIINHCYETKLINKWCLNRAFRVIEGIVNGGKNMLKQLKIKIITEIERVSNNQPTEWICQQVYKCNDADALQNLYNDIITLDSVKHINNLSIYL